MVTPTYSHRLCLSFEASPSIIVFGELRRESLQRYLARGRRRERSKARDDERGNGARAPPQDRSSNFTQKRPWPKFQNLSVGSIPSNLARPPNTNAYPSMPLLESPRLNRWRTR